MSVGRRSGARISGRGSPWSIPTLTPFVPGNRPNMLSKVRFSLMTKTTCLIGVAVSSGEASKGSGAVPYSSGGTGAHSGRSSPQATATRAIRATRATRRTARTVPTRYPRRERPTGGQGAVAGVQDLIREKARTAKGGEARYYETLAESPLLFPPGAVLLRHERLRG